MAKLTITGRVLVRESHQGVAGVVVRAVWVLDGGKEVHVGSAVSTDRGAFVVSGEAADGTQTLRVIVDAPLGSAFDKPLAVSPPRIVAGGHEEFEIWLDDATVAAAGIVRPSHGGTTVADPLSLLARAGGDQARRAVLDQGVPAVLAPRVAGKRQAAVAAREEVTARLLGDLGVMRPGRPRVLVPGADLPVLVAGAIRDGITNVRAGRPTHLRLLITDDVLASLRTAPGGDALARERVEAIAFGDGARARVREDAIARYCGRLLRRMPALDLPPSPPPPASPPPTSADLDGALAAMVDEIARRSAPVIDTRADQQSVGARLRQLDLAAGPADRTALFDYGILVGTIDGVWQEHVDDDLIATATDLHVAIGAGGGALPRTGPLLRGLTTEVQAIASASGDLATGDRPAPSPTARWAIVAAVDYVVDRLTGDADAAPAPSHEQDHRGDGTITVRPDRGLWVQTEPRMPEYKALLAELEDRLSEPYTFQVFAADGDDRALDFGLFVTYRQRWEPRGHQAGALVKTITLAPREERGYVTRTTYKRATSSVQATNLERSDRTETQDTMRSAADIVNAAKSSLGFEVTAEGTVGIGELFSADTSATLTQGSERSSQETRQLMREGVRRSAQEAKSSTRTEITTSESTEVFSEETGKLVNPNEELPVTYLFYELQRRFQVSERVHRMVPVVMVARSVPPPDRITRAWLFTHGWILRRALLDEQFMAPLGYLMHDAAGAEARLGQLQIHRDGLRRLVDRLSDEVDRLSRDTATRYGAVAKAFDALARAQAADGNDGFIERAAEAVLGSDNSVEIARLREQMAKEAYDQALRAERDARDRLTQAASSLELATKEHADALARFRDSEMGVRRLRVHVKQHILHYMRAIWNAEDRDQRYFELHSVRVPRLAGYLDYRLIETPGTPPVPPLWQPPYTIEATLVPENVDPMADTVRLGDVADLEHPIGYKGNFMVFPLRQHNVLTKYLALPYLDNRDGACDPELLANYTPTELLAYAEAARQGMPRDQFAAVLPKIHALLDALDDRPVPSEEEVVVPTGSTFIEALPGTRPVLEDFRLLHRAIDVSRVAAEVRRRELDNLRRVALIRQGQLGDPDIETMVVAPPGSGTVIDGRSPGAGNGEDR